MSNYLNLETIGIHLGSFRKDHIQSSLAVPIHQTSSFEFNSTNYAANIGDTRSLAIHPASKTHSHLKG